jgi:hypothetical protein
MFVASYEVSEVQTSVMFLELKIILETKYCCIRKSVGENFSED